MKNKRKKSQLKKSLLLYLNYKLIWKNIKKANKTIICFLVVKMVLMLIILVFELSFLKYIQNAY